MKPLFSRLIATLTDEELDTLNDAAQAEQRRRKDADDERRRASIRAGKGDPGPRRRHATLKPDAAMPRGQEPNA